MGFFILPFAEIFGEKIVKKSKNLEKSKNLDKNHEKNSLNVKKISNSLYIQD